MKTQYLLLSLIGMLGCTGVNPEYSPTLPPEDNPDLSGTVDGGSGNPQDLRPPPLLDLTSRQDLTMPPPQRTIQLSMPGQVGNFCTQQQARAVVRVTSNPAGLDCGKTGTTCSTNQPNNRSVTLTAEAPAGMTLRWNGCQASGNSCVVAAGNNTANVTLTLEATNLLTVTSGRFSGINVTPVGSLAGGFTTVGTAYVCAQGMMTCCALYAPGTSITLTGTGNWGDACDATANSRPCTLTMNGPRTVSIGP